MQFDSVPGHHSNRVSNQRTEIWGRNIEFVEGDVEAMPYPGGAFDVVLSQFGHMFAPRPLVAIAEILRVLKPGGRIAFATWPPELLVGRMFSLIAKILAATKGCGAAGVG